MGLQYVCRTAKNAVLYEDGQSFSFSDLLVQPVQRLVYQRRLCGPVTALA
jgi:hypothetical protein